MKSGVKFTNIFKKQIFIPLAAIILLALINLIVDPSFFKIKLSDNMDGFKVLSGHLITILDSGSELAILAIGMTLVTAASGGQDISVGATMAIAGSVVVRMIGLTYGAEDNNIMEYAMPLIIAFLIAVVVSMLFGAFNGALVSFFKIQPMVATLILFTAGRSIARWINLGKNVVVSNPSFKYAGVFLPGVPVATPIIITIVCIIIIMLVLKFTNLGLYTQTVGINERSARLNGLNPKMIKMLAFIILGICVAVAAMIQVSRYQTINYSSFGKDIEMDAILAVALGGNALSGGKFSMMSSILGAYAYQFLTTTLLTFNAPPDALPAYKAGVVILLVVFSAPTVRDKISKLFKQLKNNKKSGEAKEVA
ncbi:MAG: ABC transporter permease [Lachnospiraceae bacterium]|nr:ABC transporter permease [Lachnospiraceae bacterium]